MFDLLPIDCKEIIIEKASKLNFDLCIKQLQIQTNFDSCINELKSNHQFFYNQIFERAIQDKSFVKKGEVCKFYFDVYGDICFDESDLFGNELMGETQLWYNNKIINFDLEDYFHFYYTKTNINLYETLLIICKSTLYIDINCLMRIKPRKYLYLKKN